MKKYLAIVLIGVAFPLLTQACDICGCGVGNSYIGILPDFSKKIVGVRYRYNSLVTHLGVGGASTYLTTSETYKTAELWGGYNIGSTFRIMASVPYSFNEHINQGEANTKSGLSDISVSGYYQAINRRNTVFTSKLLVQSLWLGVGIKAPSGKYNNADKTGINENTNLFQLGTGSTDFTLNAMYDIRLQDAGINLATNYKFNTANKYDYKYGNKLSLNSQFYYKFRIKNKVTIAPNTGIQYEKAQQDKDHQFLVHVSGGNILLGTVGLEANFKKISAGANYQAPIHQNLGSGFVKANNRFMVHTSLAL